MVPLLVTLRLNTDVEARSLVTAIGWLELEGSLVISLSPCALSPRSLSIVINGDGPGEEIGELVDSRNDRVALVTGIQGVDRADRLLSQAIERFVETEPAPIVPNIPPLPVVCQRANSD